MKVRATVADCYSVQLPAVLNLAKDTGYTYSGEYEIGCKGVISDINKIVVNPVASSFTMTGVNTSHTVTGTITQDKNKFSNSAWHEKDGTNGWLYVPTEEAGNYTESFISEDLAQFADIGIDDYTIIKGKASVEFDVVDRYSGSVGFEFSLVRILVD